MPNYFNNTTFDRKDIDQELIDLWVSTDNPKLGEYTLTPPQPEPDAIWGPGYWIIPPPPTYTANAQLQAAGKSSAKLNAVKAWTNQILAEYVNNAEPKADWGYAPFGFNETVTEAYNELAI